MARPAWGAFINEVIAANVVDPGWPVFASAAEFTRREGNRQAGATPSAHIPQYVSSIAKRRPVALMIVETFFLVEEKRAVGTQNFQDLFEYVAFTGNCGAYARRENWRLAAIQGAAQ
jgi:hypothetical protein